jgi:hypothetical protein
MSYQVCISCLVFNTSWIYFYVWCEGRDMIFLLCGKPVFTTHFLKSSSFPAGIWWHLYHIPRPHGWMRPFLDLWKFYWLCCLLQHPKFAFLFVMTLKVDQLQKKSILLSVSFQDCLATCVSVFFIWILYRLEFSLKMYFTFIFPTLKCSSLHT